MNESTTWDLVALVLHNSRRVLLFGSPGTGKTYAATRLGINEEQPVYSVTLQEETPAAELRGHFVPDGEKFLWMDGPGVRAWEEGGVLVLNEIDHASADVMSFLHVLLDDPEFAQLTLPTGRTVTPHPNFRVVATMNGEEEDLPSALIDRFPVSMEIKEINPAALNALPDDLKEVALRTANLKDDRRIGIRAWLEYASLRERIGPERAARVILGEQAYDLRDALQIASL